MLVETIKLKGLISLKLIAPLCLHGEPPRNIDNAKEYVDEALSIAMHAMRATMHSTLGSSPGTLALNWDMLLNNPLIANWQAITLK